MVVVALGVSVKVNGRANTARYHPKLVGCSYVVVVANVDNVAGINLNDQKGKVCSY